LLPYILFEKYIDILALETVSPVNRHCVNCIGALSFRTVQETGDSEWRGIDGMQ